MIPISRKLHDSLKVMHFDECLVDKHYDDNEKINDMLFHLFHWSEDGDTSINLMREYISGQDSGGYND